MGGVPYLTPSPHLDKIYSMRLVGQLAGLPSGLMIGSGAVDFNITEGNCEVRESSMLFTLAPSHSSSPKLMANVNLATKTYGSYLARVDHVGSVHIQFARSDDIDVDDHVLQGGAAVLDRYPHDSFALMLNALLSEGHRGQVHSTRPLLYHIHLLLLLSGDPGPSGQADQRCELHQLPPLCPGRRFQRQGPCSLIITVDRSSPMCCSRWGSAGCL